MKIAIALLSVSLVGCVSYSTTRIDDLYPRATGEALGHLSFEMPEYPPHPDPSLARSVTVAPEIGKPAFGGYILGTHRGEWGGELAFRHPDGSTEVFLHEPVRAIENVGGSFVAFAGLAHLGSNRGAIYRVIEAGSGDVKIELVSELSGAPIYVGRGRNGDVLFLTRSNSSKRDGLRIISVFDCYSFGADLLVRQASCARVRATR